MSSRKAAFIYSAELEKYPYPPDCPFDNTRSAKLKKTLTSMGLLSGSNIHVVSPLPAQRVTLKKFHTARYLHALKTATPKRWNMEMFQMGIGTPDCPVFNGLYQAAVLACGATLKGVELILEEKVDIAFNPSGGLHHAMPEKASGFCYINDVALACLILAEAGKKVLYLDIDVHHGDGVVYGCYDRNDIMTISMHENPRTLFPGTGFEDEIGTGKGKGFCVNIPLPAGTYDQAYLKAYKEIAVPLIEVFDPDVFVFELGADTLAEDPLAHLYLTNNAYVEIIQSLLGFDKPIVATGGGGYNIPDTVRAWALAWSVLCGCDDHLDMDIGVGGLRDRELVINTQQTTVVMPAVDNVIKAVKKNVFPLHGLCV